MHEEIKKDFKKVKDVVKKEEKDLVKKDIKRDFGKIEKVVSKKEKDLVKKDVKMDRKMDAMKKKGKK